MADIRRGIGMPKENMKISNNKWTEIYGRWQEFKESYIISFKFPRYNFVEFIKSYKKDWSEFYGRYKA